MALERGMAELASVLCFVASGIRVTIDPKFLGQKGVVILE